MRNAFFLVMKSMLASTRFLCLLVLVPITVSTTTKALAREKKNCDIIGRVLQSLNSNFSPGDGVCKNTYVEIKSPIRVSCTKARKVLWVQGNEDLSLCTKINVSPRKCNRSYLENCSRFRVKNPTFQPRILRPYGDLYLNRPKSIEWEAVPGTAKYNVWILLSTGRSWNVTTFETIHTMPELELGPYYNLYIEAHDSNGKVLNTLSKTFFELDEKKKRQVETDLSLVRQMAIDEVERKEVLNSIFFDAGLHEEEYYLGLIN